MRTSRMAQQMQKGWEAEFQKRDKEIAAGPAADSRPSAALEVFVRDGCPHCEDAKVFLEKLRRELGAGRSGGDERSGLGAVTGLFGSED